MSNNAGRTRDLSSQWLPGDKHLLIYWFPPYISSLPNHFRYLPRSQSFSLSVIDVIFHFYICQCFNVGFFYSLYLLWTTSCAFKYLKKTAGFITYFNKKRRKDIPIDMRGFMKYFCTKKEPHCTTPFCTSFLFSTVQALHALTGTSQFPGFSAFLLRKSRWISPLPWTDFLQSINLYTPYFLRFSCSHYICKFIFH